MAQPHWRKDVLTRQVSPGLDGFPAGIAVMAWHYDLSLGWYSKCDARMGAALGSAVGVTLGSVLLQLVWQG